MSPHSQLPPPPPPNTNFTVTKGLSGGSLRDEATMTQATMMMTVPPFCLAQFCCTPRAGVPGR